MEWIGWILLGAVVGYGISFCLERSQRMRLEKELGEKREKLSQKEEERIVLQQENLRLALTAEHERKAMQEKFQLLEEAKENLRFVFQSLSAEALRQNNQSFLALAQSVFTKHEERAQAVLSQKEEAVEKLVSPIHETLERAKGQIEALEKARLSAYSSLSEQIKALLGVHDKLQSETGNLVKALKMPVVRGRWGEIQLKRVVEIAGMLSHCDFVEQPSVTTETGRLRPDLIVHLPGQKYIVVDAKAPLQAYLEAIEAMDEPISLLKRKEHARQIRTHMAQLSAKSYWEQFQPTPEFVVLFLPGESFFSAALEQDPALIEEGVQQQVILATPTTLISLLRAVHYGWRQERIAEHAQQISELGQELYDRLATMVDHINKMGASLGKAVEFFNACVASFETRILPSARKFKEWGVGSKREMEDILTIDKNIRLTPLVPDKEDPLPQKEFPFASKDFYDDSLNG